jgi:hypothetical protein
MQTGFALRHFDLLADDDVMPRRVSRGGRISVWLAHRCQSSFAAARRHDRAASNCGKRSRGVIALSAQFTARIP